MERFMMLLRSMRIVRGGGRIKLGGFGRGWGGSVWEERLGRFIEYNITTQAGFLLIGIGLVLL